MAHTNLVGKYQNRDTKNIPGIEKEQQCYCLDPDNMPRGVNFAKKYHRSIRRKNVSGGILVFFVCQNYMPMLEAKFDPKFLHAPGMVLPNIFPEQKEQ